MGSQPVTMGSQPEPTAEFRDVWLNCDRYCKWREWLFEETFQEAFDHWYAERIDGTRCRYNEQQAEHEVYVTTPKKHWREKVLQ